MLPARVLKVHEVGWLSTYVPEGRMISCLPASALLSCTAALSVHSGVPATPGASRPVSHLPSPNVLSTTSAVLLTVKVLPRTKDAGPAAKTNTATAKRCQPSLEQYSLMVLPLFQWRVSRTKVYRCSPRPLPPRPPRSLLTRIDVEVPALLPECEAEHSEQKDKTEHHDES